MTRSRCCRELQQQLYRLVGAVVVTATIVELEMVGFAVVGSKVGDNVRSVLVVGSCVVGTTFDDVDFPSVHNPLVIHSFGLVMSKHNNCLCGTQSSESSSVQKFL